MKMIRMTVQSLICQISGKDMKLLFQVLKLTRNEEKKKTFIILICGFGEFKKHDYFENS